jgi:hypothetical protein
VYMCDCNCFLFCVKNLCVHCINVKGLKLTFVVDGIQILVGI